MRATSETLAPGSRDAATSRSFSSCDHRRRRSTDVITSAREIVIALLLELPLGTAALAPLKQDGLWRRNTFQESGVRFLTARHCGHRARIEIFRDKLAPNGLSRGCCDARGDFSASRLSGLAFWHWQGRTRRGRR